MAHSYQGVVVSSVEMCEICFEMYSSDDLDTYGVCDKCNREE